jgi:hypothetical protein
MSLVSEALRKARAGSPDPGAHRHGVVYRTTVVLGEGRRPGRRWPMLAAIVAAAAAGGGAAWWLLDRTPALPGPEAAAVTRPAEPAAEPPARTPASASAPAAQTPAAPPPRPSPSTRHAGLTAITAPGAAGAAPPTAAAPLAAHPTPPPAPSAARQAPPAPPAGGVRTFGLDADLGYAKLHLDYIVYRSKDPFAGINGQQVVIGSIVQGFTVEEIGPDSIRLHDPRGELVLQIPH